MQVTRQGNRYLLYKESFLIGQADFLFLFGQLVDAQNFFVFHLSKTSGFTDCLPAYTLFSLLSRVKTARADPAAQA